MACTVDEDEAVVGVVVAGVVWTVAPVEPDVVEPVAPVDPAVVADAAAVVAFA